MRPPTSLWLTALLARGGAAALSYPETIEIDLLFPRNNATYNNLTSFPLVLAIQNAPAAYAFDWSISWKMYNASPSARAYDYSSGYSSSSHAGLNDFAYVYDNVALAPTTGYNFTVLKAGSYRLEWEYEVSPCSMVGDTTVYHLGRTVASGAQYFTIVTDGSGRGFEIPLDECPDYGDRWTVRDATYSLCPFLGEEEDIEEDVDPCRAKLTDAGQVQCLRDYFAGDNATTACREAFEVRDASWNDPDAQDRENTAALDRPGLVGVLVVAALVVLYG